MATPHLPHGWECGYLMEEATRTLLCGDLFTQGGAAHAPVTEDDILEPSEAFRGNMDYYSHTKNPGVERSGGSGHQVMHSPDRASATVQLSTKLSECPTRP